MEKKRKTPSIARFAIPNSLTSTSIWFFLVKRSKLEQMPCP
jgi:hypothetical protein